MELPGRIGYSILSDESIQFVRQPLAYLNSHRKQYGDVFVGRVMNKPTVFVTSSKAVRELLNEKWQNFSMGYREFLFQLFEDNLVLLEGDAWHKVRSSIDQVFQPESLSQVTEQGKRLIQEHMRHTQLEHPVVAYEMLKKLTTKLSINLFLSSSFTSEEMEEISDLMTKHWHGIISVPVRIPLVMWKSGYSKALDAKERLKTIISEKLTTAPSVIASGIHDRTDKDVTVSNLLLFISALIPKALASLMTSILLELAKPENVQWLGHQDNDEVLSDIILEVCRLWPPFLGGGRICTKHCELAGYAIPEGYLAAFISRCANRDPSVFPDPDMFRPERWRNENKGDRDLVWTFGGGPRVCIGRFLIEVILKEWLKELLATLEWRLVKDQDLTYKTLPVSRPRVDLEFIFSAKPSAFATNK